jgi:hypothetical protein
MAAKEPTTGYEVCLGMIAIIETQQQTLRRRQKDADEARGLVAEIHNLARAAAVVQAELRKTHEDAARALKAFPIERKVELILGIVKKLPPEYRQAISDYLAELGSGLVT